jgi:leucyl/phenylalanyl-tRNA--protein transferase
MIPWITSAAEFPPVERALRDPPGLLCAGADLEPQTILTAYTRGIFPWYSDGQPILWWSTDPRMVLFPAEFKISRSLAKTIKRQVFEVRIDTAFRAVIEACAAPREPGGGTWIVPDMQDAYTRLFELGHAHSVECWRDDRLVGGLYGMAIGRVFFGESMFARETDASKVALAALVSKLEKEEFGLIDCQQETRHLASVGARPIPRAEFARRLKELINLDAFQSVWQG